MKLILLAFKRYTDIEGRSNRKEFWYFSFFIFLLYAAGLFLDNLFNTTIGILPYGVFFYLIGLGTVVPSVAVSVRRLHDIGKSGWMQFIVIIPIVGPVWLLVLFCRTSERSENQYGSEVNDK